MAGRRLNCWDYQKCGREPGGAKVAEKGACPAAVEARLDGCNSGRNGGRACWVISGTLCEGMVCDTFEQKFVECRKCSFYKAVQKEEGNAYEPHTALLLKLAQAS